ncbi:hypothetical protein Dip518_000273 [Parelusimicrobium proximum]|uniref:hypothetical protein n=1 Tax=Parelusimicrobium proximum TaxID=3228953 RepID=UPI003D1636AF
MKISAGTIQKTLLTILMTGICAAAFAQEKTLPDFNNLLAGGIDNAVIRASLSNALNNRNVNILKHVNKEDMKQETAFYITEEANIKKFIEDNPDLITNAGFWDSTPVLENIVIIEIKTRPYKIKYLNLVGGEVLSGTDISYEIVLLYKNNTTIKSKNLTFISLKDKAASALPVLTKFDESFIRPCDKKVVEIKTSLPRAGRDIYGMKRKFVAKKKALFAAI